MLNNLFQVICRVGIFMICAQAMVHFRPEEAYEKYLKLLVSAMVLIQLFLPVGRLFFHGDSEELALKSEAFLEALEADMEAAESSAYEAEAFLEQMTLEEVRRRAEEDRAAAQENGVPENSGNGETEVGGTESSADAAGMELIEVEPVEEIRIQIPENDPESFPAAEAKIDSGIEN